MSSSIIIIFIHAFTYLLNFYKFLYNLKISFKLLFYKVENLQYFYLSYSYHTFMRHVFNYHILVYYTSVHHIFIHHVTLRICICICICSCFCFLFAFSFLFLFLCRCLGGVDDRTAQLDVLTADF